MDHGENNKLMDLEKEHDHLESDVVVVDASVVALRAV